MNYKTIGDKNTFAITYRFFKNEPVTEIAMFINGTNILAFNIDGKDLTTTCNLNELVEWLREFVDNLKEDPYPVQADGEFAAVKDINARNFNSDNLEEFNRYYDKLDDWNLRHRWHPASSGAILADVYFQQVRDQIEISWNNIDSENDVTFKKILGGYYVPKELFIQVVNAFLEEYSKYWDRT